MTPVELSRISTTIPEFRWRLERLIQNMAARGFDVYVGRTRGTSADVAAAVAAGRASAGMVHDWHMLDRAADLRLRKKDGGPNYDTGPASESFWKALYEEATALGLRNLAYREDGTKLLIHTAKGTAYDPGHTEYRSPYLTLVEAVKAELKQTT